MQANAPVQTVVEHYNGSLGLKKMLEKSLEAKGEFLGLVDVEKFSAALGPRYLEAFFRKRAERGIRSRIIWPEKGEFYKKTLPNAKEYKIQVRLLPFKKEWRSGIISWNNYLSMNSFNPKAISSTIIQSDDITYFYREVIFEVLWNTARSF